MPRWSLWILALGSGLALPLAFAPTEWWWLALISIGLFYSLLQNVTPKQALFLGWLFGLGYFGVGVHWIYHSLHLFGAAIAPLAALLTLVFVLVMTVFPALTAYVWVRLRRADAVLSNVFLFAAVWTLSELLRGKLLDGFPWILVGYSQTSGPLGNLAPVVGVYGLSFFVVLIAALCMVLVSGASKKKVMAVVIIVMPVLASMASGAWNFSQPVGEPVRVRMVQANIAQEMKFSADRLRTALTDYSALSQQPGLSEVDLVVWPETAIPTYFDRVENFMQPFVEDMDQLGVDVLSGGFERDGDDIYNAVQQLGGEQQSYRKRHLVPFGEYMPLRFILDFAAKFIVIPMSDLSAGSGAHEPLSLQGVQWGVSICYEDVYGEEMRQLLPASQVLLNVSNDAWFGNSAAPHQHEQKARMRAREFSRPLVRVTNTGVSSAIDKQGRILGRIPHNTSGILDVDIQPQEGWTPYARTGNWPVFILCLAIFFLFLSLHRLYERR